MSSRSTVLPLAIRDMPPGPGFTRIAGTHTNGLPDGVHTGGVWVSPDGAEYWKPLDGRPWANAGYHVPTREAECLELMAGGPGFPRNWRVEEAGTLTQDGVTYTRRWVVREKAWVVPDDWPPHALRLEHVLEIERGLRLLNTRGWTLGDGLKVAIDREGRPFILDLSCARPDDQADDEWRLLRWAEAMGFERLVRLRKEARRLVSSLAFAGEYDYEYWRAHVYASRNRPVSGLWADIPGAVYVEADHALTGVWTWVVVPEPLDDETARRYELTWAWSPVRRI